MDHPSSNLEGLIYSINNGDESAWSGFVAQLAPLVRWAIKQKALQIAAAADDSDVNEILQLTFTKIWQKNLLKRLQNPSSVRAYLTIIAQNQTIDFLRQRFKENMMLSEGMSPEDVPALHDPCNASHNKQLYKAIEELIDTFPVKERRILTLDLLYDLKHKDIASIMQVPVNTISTIISRCREVLRNKLKERGYDA